MVNFSPESSPQLNLDESFRRLRVQRIEDAPSLHLDDFASTPLVDRFHDVTFLEDRARLRAGDGDFVASCAEPVPGFEDYCAQKLGLGSPVWLHPQAAGNPLTVAHACWQDRAIRRTLVQALRKSEIRYLHPYIGNFASWELASQLHHASRRPINVIAPPPGLTQFVNNKLHFAHLVEQVFGKRLIPPTGEAFNFTSLTPLVRELAESSETIVLKAPESSGGAGNLVLKAHQVRGKSLAAISAVLMELLAEINWQGRYKLLVGAWESDVLSTPSAQIWIPPEADGPPIVEGVFEQIIQGRSGFFVGNRPASLPADVCQQIVDHCGLLALLFQRLGYVGRCSFDLVLVGKNLGSCRLEFIECNGRWGGTSLPMTLMNRLVGDFAKQAYAVRDFDLPGLHRFSFLDLLRCFEDDLFDSRTKQGKFVFFNVGRMKSHSAITVLAMADSREAVNHLIASEFPARARALLA